MFLATSFNAGTNSDASADTNSDEACTHLLDLLCA